MSGCCDNCGEEDENLIRLLLDAKGQKTWSDNYDFSMQGMKGGFSSQDLCLQCWSEIEDEEDIDTLHEFDTCCGNQCGSCKFRFPGSVFFFCESCDKSICCIGCVAITGCQTRECVCKRCFDGLCIKCHTVVLPATNECWLWDSEPRPLCESCKISS